MRKIIANDGNHGPKSPVVPCHNLATAIFYRDCAASIWANAVINVYPEAFDRAPYLVKAL